MKLSTVEGHNLIAKAGISIEEFINRLDKQGYDPQAGNCVSFAVCLYELFDGDALLSCWTPHGATAPGTLHTVCIINGTPYDSHGIADVDNLVDMGFEEVLHYSSPHTRGDYEWAIDADNSEVRAHVSEHMLREQSPRDVMRDAVNYDEDAHERVRRDFEQTVQTLRDEL